MMPVATIVTVVIVIVLQVCAKNLFRFFATKHRTPRLSVVVVADHHDKALPKNLLLNATAAPLPDSIPMCVS